MVGRFTCRSVRALGVMRKIVNDIIRSPGGIFLQKQSNGSGCHRRSHGSTLHVSVMIGVGRRGQEGRLIVGILTAGRKHDGTTGDNIGFGHIISRRADGTVGRNAAHITAVGVVIIVAVAGRPCFACNKGANGNDVGITGVVGQGERIKTIAVQSTLRKGSVRRLYHGRVGPTVAFDFAVVIVIA